MEEQTNEQSEELEELDLFVWSEEDLAKPLEQSPKFDYMKSIGDNFRKIKDKDKKNTEAINNKADKATLDDLVKIVQSMQTTTHRINVTTDIEENTEYELPCSYIVGSGDIEIYCNNEIMIRAIEESWGNFAEVGAGGNISNKVVFGQTIEAGSVLIVKKTGVIANE